MPFRKWGRYQAILNNNWTPKYISTLGGGQIVVNKLLRVIVCVFNIISSDNNETCKWRAICQLRNCFPLCNARIVKGFNLTCYITISISTFKHGL